MANPLAVTLLASGPQTVSGTGATVDLQASSEKARTLLRLQLRISAVSGASVMLTAKVETSPDGSTWEQIGSFAPTYKASFETKIIAGCERYIRLTWVIAGTTPSFTFGVLGTAEVVYATLTEFAQLGLPTTATENLEDEQLLQALLSASSTIDSYIPKRFLLPLTPPYPDVLVEHACRLAAWTVLRVRGVDPDSAADKAIQEASDGSEKWLLMVAKGTVEPSWVDATPTIYEGGAAVESDTSRGW